MPEQRAPRLSTLPPLEARLQRRYQQLVQEQLQVSQRVAAGWNALPGTASSFASTQAAWRFYRNPTVSLPALAQPLIAPARRAVATSWEAYGLVRHDGSHLNYPRHTRKRDRLALSHDRDQGYELQTALLVSDRTGAPRAPVCQNLVSAAGVQSTRREAVLPKATRLDELAGRREHLAGLALGRPLVPIHRPGRRFGGALSAMDRAEFSGAGQRGTTGAVGGSGLCALVGGAATASTPGFGFLPRGAVSRAKGPAIRGGNGGGLEPADASKAAREKAARRGGRAGALAADRE